MKLCSKSFIVLSLFALCGCGNGSSDVVATIDSTIPGTEVYHRATLLGTTPLRVTRAMCTENGFAIPKDELVVDGWGEGLAFGQEDEDESRIMFLVPKAKQDNYLTIETPWGMRTKRSGSSGNHNGAPVVLKTDFMQQVDADGIRLELHPIPTAKPSEEIELRVTLSGTGTKEIEGHRPELMALWGSFDTPWRHRSSTSMQLEESAASILPGETVEISVPMRVPNVASDYSVFVVFHLFKEDKGDDLKIGAVYSESRYLRVRR